VETIGPGLWRFNHTISFRAYNATYDDDITSMLHVWRIYIGPGLWRFNHTISFRTYNATYDDDDDDTNFYLHDLECMSSVFVSKLLTSCKVKMNNVKYVHATTYTNHTK
jgi:hypothetical protein